jgi:putative ABC transport system permease protein
VGLYHPLVLLFPREFRGRFGEEMRRAFSDGCRDSLRRHGSPGLLLFLVREVARVPMEAAGEHLVVRRERLRPGSVGGTKRIGRRAPGRTGGPRGPDARGNVLDTLVQDLRFALRTYARRPGFTAVSLLTLTLGIGAASAIFSVVSGVLLRPFPYPDADELVVLWNTNPERGQDEYRMAGVDFFELERSSGSFQGMALVAGATTSLTGEDLPPMRAEGAAVSAGFFQILGIQPLLGRPFTAQENRGDHGVVILSHALWQGRFGGDPQILGKRITMDGTEVMVVGIMPRTSIPVGGGTLRLPGPEAPVYWTPLDYTLDWVSEIRAHVMAVVARLAPGVTLGRAQDEMTAMAHAMEERGDAGQGIIVRPLREQIVGDIRHNLLILMGAVGLLLLMACGNLTNLFLARATSRKGELAVRTALGANRGRLLRQVLTETTLLGSVGGLLGLVFARWGTGILLALTPSSLPRQSEVGVDGRVLLFTLGSVLLAPLVAGLVPSLQMSGREPERGLRGSGRGGSPGRRRNRANRSIVVFQFALAAILLVGAGLLARSFQALRSVDPGFRSQGVLTAQLILPPNRYSEPEGILAFYDELRRGVESLPGVTSAVFSMDHPMQTSWWNGVTLLDQPPPREGEGPIGFFRPVSEGYFRLHQIPILEGRAFRPTDRLGQPGVMVVNQAFARKYFPQGNPLGEGVRFMVGQAVWGPGAPTDFEVVGVVGDVRFNGLREPTEPAFYIPLRQFPYMAVKIQVKTPGNPEALADALRAEIWRLDPELPITEVRTMDQILASAVAQDRFNAILLGAFALAALMLAGAGIFGVLSYVVAQRTGEMGVRLALGAEPGTVLAMVVRDGVKMAAQGLAGGVVLYLLLAPLLASLLFGVPPRDPLVLATVGVVLGSVALVSGVVPAWRAARIDPVEAMKGE